MFQYEPAVHSCRSVDLRQITDPQARQLVQALDDCCHPRADRLRLRLLQCKDKNELCQLRSDVVNLLALSFGLAEAASRLQLQWSPTGLPAW